MSQSQGDGVSAGSFIAYLWKHLGVGAFSLSQTVGGRVKHVLLILALLGVTAWSFAAGAPAWGTPALAVAWSIGALLSAHRESQGLLARLLTANATSARDAQALRYERMLNYLNYLVTRAREHAEWAALPETFVEWQTDFFKRAKQVLTEARWRALERELSKFREERPGGKSEFDEEMLRRVGERLPGILEAIPATDVLASADALFDEFEKTVPLRAAERSD